jgi:hypothetical protein
MLVVVLSVIVSFGYAQQDLGFEFESKRVKGSAEKS